MINTVTGPVNPEDLGKTLFHEHLICTSAEFRNQRGWLTGDSVMNIILEKLKFVSEQFGIRTIIDGTPQILGRDLDFLKTVSERSGINIIASTGFYFYPSFSVKQMKPEILADFLTDEILNGKIKPAIFKCAADSDGITPVVKQALTVAAIVHQNTKIPVYLHSSATKKTGIPAVEILTGNGVPPEKIAVGHVSDSSNISYALELLKLGCNVSIDRVHNWNPAFAAALIRQGYSGRIFMSHDHICCRDMVMHQPPEPQNEPYGLDTVQGIFFPEMKKLGVDDSTLEQIISGNVRTLFSNKNSHIS